jgi:hypothetical protein
MQTHQGQSGGIYRWKEERPVAAQPERVWCPAGLGSAPEQESGLGLVRCLLRVRRDIGSGLGEHTSLLLGLRSSSLGSSARLLRDTILDEAISSTGSESLSSGEGSCWATCGLTGLSPTRAYANLSMNASW